MPEPIERGHRYLRGLDGLRAIAVLAVLGFHLGWGWAPGGLLGVAVFFTLSGYLITDLLMNQWEHDGVLHMAQFWMRRARRLLPAVAVVLLAVMLWVSIDHRSELSALWGNLWAAGGYVSNWYLIFHHVSYFARFGPPSPLGHLWSLSVEEQFYLIWPWLLLLGLKYVKTRKLLCYLALAGAALSAIEMVVLYHPGVDPTRVYDGTDTRAFGLLIGAALAFVLPSRPPRELVRRINPLVVEALGAVGLLVIFVMVMTIGQYSPFLYRGGLVILSVATAAVVAAVVYPRTTIGRVLGIRPLRWTGVRSYGIYLWHYPIIVLTTPLLARSSFSRSMLQVAATFCVAALSWRFVEDPIRKGQWQLPRLPAPQPGGPLKNTTRTLVFSSVGVTVVALMALTFIAPSKPSLSSAQVISTNPPTSVATHHGTSSSTASHLATATGSGTGRSGSHPSGGGAGSSSTTGSAASTAGSTTTSGAAPSTTATGGSTAAASAGAAETSCKSVTYIGDSTSESLVSPSYLPDPTQRLDAQLRKVGVTASNLQISGARSMWERWHGIPNGLDIAQQVAATGYKGCWVVALGFNDAADIAVGSNVNEGGRIQKMMAAIGDQPVMWVDTVSLEPSGPYSASNMAKWNQGLEQACSQYPNMRVFSWSSVVQVPWFTTDGVHYTSAGSAIRASLIAGALATSFPMSGFSTGCVVR